MPKRRTTDQPAERPRLYAPAPPPPSMGDQPKADDADKPERGVAVVDFYL